MLYRPPGTSRMIRAQGVLVTDEEIRRVVEHASAQGEPAFDNSIHERLAGVGRRGGGGSQRRGRGARGEVHRSDAAGKEGVAPRSSSAGCASATRAPRASSISSKMRGYVGAGEGAKPREILVDLDAMGE